MGGWGWVGEDMEEGNEKDQELIAESAWVTVRDGQEYMTSGPLS